MAFINKKKHYKALFLICLVMLFFLIILSSTLGVADISIKQAVYILLSKVPVVRNFINLESIKPNHIIIIHNIRLPRILLSSLVGMGLSVSGVAFQGMFKNPMADPYILGVSSGAALGATIAIILNFQSLFMGFNLVTTMAFIGAISSVFIVYSIARTGNKISTVTLLLAGVTLSFLISSIISIIMIFNRQQVDKIVFWIMGSLSSASWKYVGTILPFVILGYFVIYLFSKDLNVMLTGDDSARSLGIEVEKTKKIILFTTSLVVAASVSVSGVIGFVGLIIPHAIRILIGPDHRVLVPFSALGGAIFMIISDTLSRTLIPPNEIPVGAITSLFGAPYFIYLLIKSKKQVK
ncbi:iron complex transport system permease protein [Alkalithermobacter thermoalcaliphilus JW-YL-7 = DSM 7308]|uniref:ABC-type transporter, integral membrane subunit n=2 Tax=Clostridium paradoxum TaxID=29346 RepID=A0A150FSV9_CLOPD|nr:ABC-type transporter, integral membrane subunit [[Clostridium] paradoxum JW-YL-7 = DSM 7308]SHL18044.1 iron complex transport system permease protein [[Clostridium] paradoxum JW-YL-7 = DSM 7308]